MAENIVASIIGGLLLMLIVWLFHTYFSGLGVLVESEAPDKMPKSEFYSARPEPPTGNMLGQRMVPGDGILEVPGVTIDCILFDTVDPALVFAGKYRKCN